MNKMLVLAAAALTLGAAGASGAAAAQHSSTVVVTTKKVPKLGTILVDSKGHTLYMFEPDKQKKVTCTGSCAAAWPPLKLAKGEKAKVEGEARASLVGSDKDPSGGDVVTYNHWPLYTYVADTKAGDASGQAINLNGGLWYVLSPKGVVIKTKM